MAIISVGSRNREIWDSWETDCSWLTRVRLEIKGGPRGHCWRGSRGCEEVMGVEARRVRGIWRSLGEWRRKEVIRSLEQTRQMQHVGPKSLGERKKAEMGWDLFQFLQRYLCFFFLSKDLAKARGGNQNQVWRGWPARGWSCMSHPPWEKSSLS